MRIRGCVSLATVLQRPPPLCCLHSHLMRLNDARVVAAVLIVTEGVVTGEQSMRLPERSRSVIEM